jgi:hypothetical protein
MREAILGFVPASLILAQLAGNLPDNSPSTQVEQTLQPADFQSAANQSDVGIFGSTPVPAGTRPRSGAVHSPPST